MALQQADNLSQRMSDDEDREEKEEEDVVEMVPGAPVPGGNASTEIESGQAVAPATGPAVPKPQELCKVGSRGKRLHKQTAKMEASLNKIKDRRNSIHKLLKEVRADEKREKARIARIWKKASTLDVPTILEIAEMKKLTEQHFASLGSKAAAASSSDIVAPASTTK